MPYFTRARNVELSILDYLTTQINANWTGITTVKRFQDAYVTALPVVCVSETDTLFIKKEIGSTTYRKQFGIIIDIFANSHGQRVDLTDFITDQLMPGCVYYEFSHTSGDPTSLTKVANGRITFMTFIENHPLDFGPDGDARDRFRHVISCIVEKL